MQLGRLPAERDFALKSASVVGAAAKRAIENLQSQRLRWSLWLPAAFAAGIAIYFSLWREPPLWWGIAAVAAGLAVCWRLRHHSAAVPAIALLTLALGFLAADLRTDRVAAPVLSKRTSVVEVTGRIVRRSPDDSGTRIVVAVHDIDRIAAHRTPARVRLTWRGEWPQGVGAGDWVKLRAVLRPLPGQVAPGAFDFARYAFFRRIGALGFTVAPPELISPPKASGLVDRVSAGLGRLRRALGQRFRDAMTETEAAVATALVTGERGGIAETDLEALRGSGLAHLLAISGLHMMLVGGVAFMILRSALALSERVALTRPVTKWAALAAVPVAAAYLVVSGAPVSAQRAFLMFSLMMVAVVLDRRALSMRIVAITAVIVLVLRPESLLEAGFQMSFAAVIALIAVYEAQGEKLSSYRSAGGRVDRLIDSAWRFIAGICLTTVIASTATAPFAAFHFQHSVLYALPANLAAMPLFTILVMPFGLLAVGMMPLGLEEIPLAFMGWGINGILGVAHTVSGWPGASFELAAPPATAAIVMAIGGLWICLWRGGVRWLGMPLLAAAIIITLFTRHPDVLIDDKGELVALRLRENNHYFLTRTTPRFVAQSWLDRDGDSRSAGQAADERPENWRCDARGCILWRNGDPWFAHVRHARALAEDCGRVKILVSEEPVQGPCEGPELVVGRFDLWRKGAHAIWLADDGVTVKRLRTTGSARPWSPYGRRLQRADRREKGNLSGH